MQSKKNFDSIKVKSVFSKKRSDTLKTDGWGFKDSFYAMKDGKLVFTGNRYIISQKTFKNARHYLLELMNIDIKDFKIKEGPIHKESDYPPRIVNEELCEELKKANIEFSSGFEDRFLRCHGSALKDLYIIRYGKFKRIPDLVVWPACHEDVELIVKLANKYFSIIIPCGGNTNTMMSLSYMKNDNSRMLISVDTTQMNRILWIDEVSMLACVEAGIVGRDMENAFEKRGFTVGHEPDSIEFSTVGGWVATRSSGMKQQTYGNIEDIITRLTMVTSVGVLEKNFIVPRASVGPNFDHIILGSEGTLGIITKIVLKIHPKPKVRRFGSIVFPDLDKGISFMREVSTFSKKPSSLRLNDYYHINLGFAFEYNKSIIGSIVDSVKRIGAQYLYGYDLKKVSLAVYCIEGNKKDADDVEKNLFRITGKYGGTKTSSKYGERGFLLTHTNGYIRDFFCNLGFLIDSLEPSVSWERCIPLINAIRESWQAEMEKRKLINGLAFRISQIYGSGVCLYFYYGIGPTVDRDQYEVYEELTNILRQTIQDAGGSISHHHGVGKKNMKWYPQAVSKVGVEVLKSIKSKIDPFNVFDAGNMISIESTKSKM